jgi:hypothetical protein
LGCGGTSGSGFDSDSGGSLGGGGDASAGSQSDSSTPILTLDSGNNEGGGAPSGDAATECPPAATLVYVTGEDDDLWSFYPPSLKFTEIGKFNCLTSPTHMTIDRQGNAWVVANGRIYKASTADATCSAVSTWTPHLVRFDDFALTFIGTTNTVDPSLYIMSESTLGLFDVLTGALTVIGNAPVTDALGDMTSDGDGTLYFLWDTDTPTLYEVNPSNADVIKSTPLSPATGGGDQALAYWGGEFYAFESNVIWQYEPKTGAVGTPGSAPLSVTGAGQSTCVPPSGAPPPPPPK